MAEIESAEQFAIVFALTPRIKGASILQVNMVEARDTAVANAVLDEIKTLADTMVNQDRNNDWSYCVRAAFDEIRAKYAQKSGG